MPNRVLIPIIVCSKATEHSGVIMSAGGPSTSWELFDALEQFFRLLDRAKCQVQLFYVHAQRALGFARYRRVCFVLSINDLSRSKTDGEFKVALQHAAFNRRCQPHLGDHHPWHVLLNLA